MLCHVGMRKRLLWMLAVLAWFVSAWVFMIATAMVVTVLYWREYRSEALRTMEIAADTNVKVDMMP